VSTDAAAPKTSVDNLFFSLLAEFSTSSKSAPHSALPDSDQVENCFREIEGDKDAGRSLSCASFLLKRKTRMLQSKKKTQCYCVQR